MATAFYKYGAYQFEAGECDLLRTNVINKLSPRGNRLMREVTHFIRATIIADTQADLSARIAEIQNAFSFDYQDAGLWLDSTTPSQHLLTNDAFCVSGVRVLQRSFPEGGGDEYVTARTFSATIQAVYDDADSQYVEWHEDLQFTGTCGPTFEWIDGWFGPVLSQTAESSVQTIIQRGHGVAYGAILVPPGPLFPSYEHLEKRTITYGSPRFLGNQFRFYPTSWTYVFSSNVPLSGFPNQR